MELDDLSKAIRPIYELELSMGNLVERIDRPAGSKCPLAIIFKHELHIDEIKKMGLPSVTYWENYDPHYPIECGYFCESTRHAVAGPFKEYRRNGVKYS